MLVTKNEFMGSFAMWITRQSPYDVPENLCACLSELSTHLDKQDKSLDLTGFVLYEFHSNDDLKMFVDKAIESCPAIVSLNTPKREKTEEERFSIKFNDPDTDFIDLMALRMNVMRALATEDQLQNEALGSVVDESSNLLLNESAK